MTIVYTYTFDDGTKLQLLNVGFSTEELWKLQELHGAVVINHEKLC